jgi:hypothetical protein
MHEELEKETNEIMRVLFAYAERFNTATNAMDSSAYFNQLYPAFREYAEALVAAGFKNCKGKRLVDPEEYEKLQFYRFNSGIEHGHKEMFSAVKSLVDHTEIIVDNDVHTWQPDSGYDKKQIDEGLAKIAERFNLEVD